MINLNKLIAQIKDTKNNQQLQAIRRDIIQLQVIVSGMKTALSATAPLQQSFENTSVSGVIRTNDFDLALDTMTEEFANVADCMAFFSQMERAIAATQEALVNQMIRLGEPTK